MIEKYIKGVSEPKNRRFLRPSREITANTLMTYNFQTVQFRPLFAMYKWYYICVPLCTIFMLNK